ncbi:MAG: hypothetical protein ACRDK8_14665, partial [Solirubrobacteraceae bacterium]
MVAIRALDHRQPVELGPHADRRWRSHGARHQTGPRCAPHVHPRGLGDRLRRRVLAIGELGRAVQARRNAT